MAKLSYLKGATSVTVNIFIQDSTSTTGAGKTGLAYNTSSLVAYYAREKAASAAITLATQTTTGAYSSGGFVEIDSTNMPGVYRFDIPDAALATGSNSVLIMLKGATGMAPLVMEIELEGVDRRDATAFGLSRLDAAITTRLAPATAGRTLVVDAAGLADANMVKMGPTGSGTAQTARDIGASVLLSAGTGTGQLDFTSGVVKANATQWLGGTIPAVNVTGVPLVDLKYVLGTISPAAAGSVRADAVTGAVGSVTGLTASNLDVAVSTRLASGSYTAPDNSTISTINTTTAAIKAKTDNLPASPAAVGSAMTLTSAYDFAKGTVAMAEDYAADGAAATPAQLLYMLWSLMAEKSIATTTLTAKKLDGTTTAMSFTLDSATSPTSITRAS